MKKIYLKDLLKHIQKYQLAGTDQGYAVEQFNTIDDADELSLVWVKTNLKDKYERLRRSRARVIICGFDFEIPEEFCREKLFIRVADPKLEYLRLVGQFTEKTQKKGVHPTAFIEEGAVIHPESYIGPFCYVGKSEIGKGTILTGNCFIHDGVIIGENVLIHAGVVIGSDGYGYQRNSDKKLEKFPHIGGVIIEDDVEIGANTCVDRGTLGNTIIKQGAKIDNLVHIAHNVKIGCHAAVIANTMVGGSTVVDDYAWIAPSVSLMNGITVGTNATAGLGAVVTKNIPDNEVWAGSPARPINSFIILQNKLKELMSKNTENE